ncbi:exonuclease subunit SbcD [Vibrio albus]|uniref:Nuclease SbcCD subunit D n=1 Tax=Vibrio albus TaxID=2200953 RepID=A0A2U3B7I8_9VIBR|nr:exonuclease subunit SbcD [Vibrio albus]PWI32685.1 exonuclease subunit SbcD [Vibrio albus]
MRILHTSDWHLGQNFFTKSRKDEHQAFIRWLLELVKTEKIDAVIIAGDVFDTGTPPSYAREMYNQFVVDISRTSCQLVILGGNHDSVSTLNESRQLLSCLNTRVIASTSGELDQQLIELKNHEGQVGALLCAVPFIRARDVMQSAAGESGRDKQKQLGELIKDHYRALYQKAIDHRESHNLQVPIITTGHLTALGVTKTDSERDIYIGSLDAFAADGFPPADYIALGHIHRPQIVAKSEHIRYSGSPIPLSFDELKWKKQVVMVEFSDNEQRQITSVEVPMFRQMEVLRGDLAEIESLLSQYPPAQEEDEPVWLFIEVEVQDYLSDLQLRIQAMTEGLNVEVIRLKRKKGERRDNLTREATETLAELTPYDVFDKRLEKEQFEGEDEQKRLTRLKQKFSEIVLEVEHKEDGE